jgi:hypothetical protein
MIEPEKFIQRRAARRDFDLRKRQKEKQTEQTKKMNDTERLGEIIARHDRLLSGN